MTSNTFTYFFECAMQRAMLYILDCFSLSSIGKIKFFSYNPENLWRYIKLNEEAYEGKF